jgi:hypothetical protein
MAQKNRLLILRVDSSEVADCGGDSFSEEEQTYITKDFLIVFPTNPCFAAYLSHHFASILALEVQGLRDPDVHLTIFFISRASVRPVTRGRGGDKTASTLL